MPLPNTSPEHVPHADAGKGLLLDVLASFAKCRLTASQARARNAHGLVVVPGRASGREGVAQPEAVVLGHAVAMSEKVAVPFGAPPE